jgi:photosystem II stability/assembly factor-like uncharacterized protein
VPVSSTLLSVCFPTPELGWATGHDGVVLSSRDGGESWSKVLDGYEVVQLGLDYYSKLVEANPGSEEYALLQSEMEFAVEQGADRPFFFTYFEDARRGFLVGAYGLMLATFDGGESWQPILELSENWGFRHLFDYERVGDTYYLTGEMGLVMYQEERKTRVKTVIPFYDGSFYTMIAAENGELIVAGMRANAFRSVDGGGTWDLAVPGTAYRGLGGGLHTAGGWPRRAGDPGGAGAARRRQWIELSPCADGESLSPRWRD